MKRYVALGAMLVALGAGLVRGTKAGAQAEGGLSLLPALIQHGPEPGGLATLTIANRSAKPLAVTVTPRPWTQASDGRVSPNRRAALAGVSVGESAFTLAPGAERQVAATLDAAPAAGYLYGAIEVVGIPADASSRKGVVLGYRVVGVVRILPTTRRYGVSAGNARVSKRGDVAIPIRNTGNTLDAVSGTARVKGARGTKTFALRATRILPGRTVDLPAGTRLARGTYTATVRLTQRGKRALSATRKFRVR